MRFPSALTILEGTWTTRHVGVSIGPVVCGTKGTKVAARKAVEGQRKGFLEVYTSRDRAIGDPDQLIDEGPPPDRRETLA